VNGNSEYFIYSISNLRFAISLTSGCGNEVCMVFYHQPRYIFLNERHIMFEKNSCCSHCGTRYPTAEPWPISCRSCGHTNYLNPIPVVVLLVPVGEGLVVARRNIEPQKGTLVLPGGYLDLGETWQEGAQRELYEETGILISPDEISLYDVQNGLDNTLVVSGLAARQPLSCLQPFSSAETQEIDLIEEPIELGFPLHNLLIRRYFAGNGMRA
jgi:ADP-ribose pyrophosphatase YjhB (NUDIX family)